MNENPYSPPNSDLLKPNTSIEFSLASRWHRLFAVIIDGFISIVTIFPIMYFTDGFKKVGSGPHFSMSYYIMISILGIIVFFLLHGRLLINNGQTIGKKLLRIRIANLEGEVPSFYKNIIPRYAFTSIVSNIPVIGGIISLIDSLMIFNKDRRCLHDLIGRTQVVTDK